MSCLSVSLYLSVCKFNFFSRPPNMAVILNLAQTFYIMFMINPPKMSSLENKTKINVFLIYFSWKES